MDVLDPVKSKLDDNIERQHRSRSPKPKLKEDDRPTLESEGYKTYKSAMVNPLLRDGTDKMFTTQDYDELPEHLKVRKPGEDNPLKEPLKLGRKGLHTLNPTEDGLKPEEMVGQDLSYASHNGWEPSSGQDYGKCA